MKIVNRRCKCVTIKNANNELELAITDTGDIIEDMEPTIIEQPENKTLTEIINKAASQVNEANNKSKAIKLMSLPKEGMESTIILKFIQA